MIHSQRLEKYIHNREYIKDRNYLLESISGMTKEQFKIIRLMLQENAKRNTPSYNKR